MNKGHDITVLTGIPDYPDGRFYEGYGLFKRRREIIRAITIVRAPLIPRGKGTRFRLFANYLSYAVGASISAIFLKNNKFDVIFVHETSPITVGIPAILLKKITRTPIVFWVLDLWPESVLAAGNLKTQMIPRMLLLIVRFIYRHSDMILVASRGFIPSITRKGISEERIIHFPQWAEDTFTPSTNPSGSHIDLLPDGFRIMFAGNIGEAQDFGSILRAADLVKTHTDIHWIILGGGRKEEWVRNQIRVRGLERTFHLLGEFPIDAMSDFYCLADVMLASLKKEEIFSLTIPAKIQSYLACGKPILTMMDGEGSRIVNEAQAGLTCPAESPDELARTVLRIKEMPNSTLVEMGRNGRKYYEENFERSMLMNKAEELFELSVSSYRSG